MNDTPLLVDSATEPYLANHKFFRGDHDESQLQRLMTRQTESDVTTNRNQNLFSFDSAGTRVQQQVQQSHAYILAAAACLFQLFVGFFLASFVLKWQQTLVSLVPVHVTTLASMAQTLPVFVRAVVTVPSCVLFVLVPVRILYSSRTVGTAGKGQEQPHVLPPLAIASLELLLPRILFVVPWMLALCDAVLAPYTTIELQPLGGRRSFLVASYMAVACVGVLRYYETTTTTTTMCDESNRSNSSQLTRATTTAATSTEPVQQQSMTPPSRKRSRSLPGSVRSPPPEAFRLHHSNQQHHHCDEEQEEICMTLLEDHNTTILEDHNNTNEPQHTSLQPQAPSQHQQQPKEQVSKQPPPPLLYWQRILMFQLALLSTILWVPALYMQMLAPDDLFVWQLGGASLVPVIILVPILANGLAMIVWLATDTATTTWARRWLYCLQPAMASIVASALLLLLCVCAGVKDRLLELVLPHYVCEQLFPTAITLHWLPGCWFYVGQSILLEVFVSLTLQWSTRF